MEIEISKQAKAKLAKLAGTVEAAQAAVDAIKADRAFMARVQAAEKDLAACTAALDQARALRDAAVEAAEKRVKTRTATGDFTAAFIKVIEDAIGIKYEQRHLLARANRRHDDPMAMALVAAERRLIDDDPAVRAARTEVGAWNTKTRDKQSVAGVTRQRLRQAERALIDAKTTYEYAHRAATNAAARRAEAQEAAAAQKAGKPGKTITEEAIQKARRIAIAIDVGTHPITFPPEAK